jgi:hypothetical protein
VAKVGRKRRTREHIIAGLRALAGRVPLAAPDFDLSVHHDGAGLDVIA